MASRTPQCLCLNSRSYDSLRLLTSPFRPQATTKQSSSQSFSSSSHRAAAKKQKGQHYNARDQYLRQQAKQRREANLSRQAVLQEERAKAMGDPIRGVSTPFLESLDKAQSTQAKVGPDADSRQSLADHQSSPPSTAKVVQEKHLNHFLTRDDLAKSLEFSRTLSEPVIRRARGRVDPARERDIIEDHNARDETAREVISRITNLNNASSKEKTMTNIQRIIDRFGRHQTDGVLKPKAPANLSQPNKVTQQALPRAGPDTGSSEVQIAILTAKIRVLADRYAGENRNDKINKRNLLLLLHRRQKLLKYMEKKERGSGRWQHMVESLGLTEATWKGEISI